MTDLALTSLCTSNKLNSPLTDCMIDSAGTLFHRMSDWQAIIRAFRLLHERMPDFAYESALLKVACLNAYYGTNVYALEQMARHVSQLLSDVELGDAGPGLVDAIAALPPAAGEAHQRRFVSFAAKFAHFFIAEDRFPIYDSVTVSMLKLHFGSGKLKVRDDRRYLDFVDGIDRLREVASLTASYAELDRYLWITGSYLNWKKGKQVNAELRRFFAANEESDPEMQVFRSLLAEVLRVRA